MKQLTPEQMTVIINCQDMKEKICLDYDRFADFRNLELLTIEQLRRLQDRLIPEYNEAIKRTAS